MSKPTAWRIDNVKWKDSSFNGVGAGLEGGRWNSAGVQVVYASEHLAMAAQEKYVHLPKPVPASMKFVQFGVHFGTLAITEVTAAALPADWRAEPPGAACQAIGDAWVAAGKTAILAIPSVLIPEEKNFLLNPAHPDFKKIVILAPAPFVFTDRIARLVDPAPAPKKKP